MKALFQHLYSASPLEEMTVLIVLHMSYDTVLYNSYPHYLLRYDWWLNLQLRWGLLCNYCHMFSRWAHSLVAWWAQDGRNQLMLVKRISTSSSCILTGHRSTIVKLILHNCKYYTYYWKVS